MFDLNMIRDFDLEEFRELDKLAKEERKIAENIIIQDNRQIEMLFIKSFENIIPPLKGEITKGKLKWRGISLGVKNGSEYWVIQRGKQISPTLKIIRKFNPVNNNIETEYQFLKNEGKQWKISIN